MVFMIIRVNTGNSGAYGVLLPSQAALVQATGAIPPPSLVAAAGGSASLAQASAALQVAQDNALMSSITAATTAAAVTPLGEVAAVVDSRGNVSVSAR